MNVWARWALEVGGLLMIGEGVMATLYPRRYATLWYRGLGPLRPAVGYFRDHAELTRAVGAAEVGLGLWLATAQLRD